MRINRFLIILLVLLGISLNVYIASTLMGSKKTEPLDHSPVPTISNSSVEFVTPAFEIKLPSANEISSSVVISEESLPDEFLDSRFGHFRYSEMDTEMLMTIASFGVGEYQRFERLAPEAAFSLLRMIYAARDEGVWIVPVSAFRDTERQRQLFEAQIRRKGTPEAAAKSTAPPGYSEHHTGYAIDLTDGQVPDADISQTFAKTSAFEWLIRNAATFEYELSFPPDNPQGVMYEPWHWRFVGSEKALSIFYP